MDKKYLAAKTAFLLSCILFNSGCHERAFKGVEGRYQGYQILSTGETQQVIAQVPSFQDLAFNKPEMIEVYQTLGTAQALSYDLEFLDHEKLRLKMPSIGSSLISLELKKDSKCAVGESSAVQVTLCWTEQKLNLEVADKFSQKMKYAHYLSKESQLPAPHSSGNTMYTLDELMGRAKFINYGVSEDAERVFQAKKQVSVAIGNLLPHLNARDVLGFVGGGPLGILEMVGDLVPFLFPSNWFKWQEAGFLAQAERKSFASLRGNEMNAVEGLFYLIHRDQAVTSLFQTHVNWLKEIYAVILNKEKNDALPSGSAASFNMMLVQVEQDLEQLKVLVSQERAALGHAVALPPSSAISELALINLPDLTNVKPIQSQSFFPDAQAKSLEVATIGFLIEASRLATKEQVYGFLDPSDDKPFGFGYSSSIQISKSEEAALKIRKDEMLSLIEKRSVDVASEYNGTLSAYQLSYSGLDSSRVYLRRLMRQLISGDDLLDGPEFLKELIETCHNVLRFEANLASSSYAFLISQSKLNRLLQQGFYQNLEAAIPRIAEER